MNLSYAVQNKIFYIISHSSKIIKQNSYVIGGYVRDFLLNRIKIKSQDLDIVTIGEGILLAKKVAENIINNDNYTVEVRTFKRYGTAMIKYKNQKIEFVGSRKESYTNIYSRNPIVKIGTLYDDQNRRDFTINSLAISLNRKDYGKLIDPFGGILDLKKKIIKTPMNSDKTYSDDPLRMMRAIRFATQLKFSIEKKSFISIKKNKNRIKIVSKERIVDEFNKILLSNTPSIGLLLLHKSELLKIILPEVTLLEGVEEKFGFKHKDNFYHTLKVVDNISKKKNSVWLRWCALLHDIGKYPTKRFCPKIGWTFHNHEIVGSELIHKIFCRLKLPKGKIIRYVKKIIRNSCRPVLLSNINTSDSAIRRLIFDMGEDLEDLIELCLSDITTNNIEKKIFYRKKIFYLVNRIKNLEKNDSIKNWKSPISGYDIMNEFKINPCKKVGIIKNFIKESILDGKISNDFNSAYKAMLKKGKELGLIKK